MARSSVASRVTKPYVLVARRRTFGRPRSEFAVEASDSESVSDGASDDEGDGTLQRMVDEVSDAGIDTSMALDNDCSNDHNLALALQAEENARAQANATPPYEQKPFPLMRLPAELRNEIYRACLTRPFDVLLSRQEPPPKPVKSKPEVLPPPAKPKDGAEVIDLTMEDDDTCGDIPGADGGAALARVQAAPAAQRNDPLSTERLARATRLTSRNGRSKRPVYHHTPSFDSNDSVTSSASIGTVLRGSSHRSRRSAIRAPPRANPNREPRPQDEDPLIISLLQVSKQVYREARSVMYSENMFSLDLYTAGPTLAALHQRSRRQIKHVEVVIACYNEILEKFQETVRLSLRYCWGLQTLVIHMPFVLPGAEGSGTSGNALVYANGFDILRWLPSQCKVILKGNVCPEIEAVVRKNATLAKTLDEVEYENRKFRIRS